MRVEIYVADERPEAKNLAAVSDPSAYVLELVRRAGQDGNPSSSMPDYMAILDQASQSPNRFRTREEVDAYISELRAER